MTLALRLSLAAYSVLYTLAVLFYSPVFLYRSYIRKKHRIDVLQRAGRLPPFLQDGIRPLAVPRLWVHAVSVGEVNAIRPLVGALLQQSAELFVSTTTGTGQELARDLFKDRARVFYLPLDWKWNCTRFLKRVAPSMILLAESEIWPNFIASASRLNIPVLVINGRISNRSFRRYGRIRPLWAPLLRLIRHFCMQSREDRDRVLNLGVPADQVNWVGNLKFDYQLPESQCPQELLSVLKPLLLPETDSALWICGSTGEGEEEALLAVFERVRRDFPSLRLLLAPRHPHRGDAVARLAASRRLRVLRRSQFPFSESAASPPEVFILDSIGELAHVYQLATVVFVGGSLTAVGGHNVIEAAWFGKPILVGPHMENFQEVLETFQRHYALLQVENARELEARIRDLLRDEDSRNWLGRNARKVIRQNQGALARTLEIIAPYLAARRPAKGLD